MEVGEEGEAPNPNLRARHITKRALRNKGLSISFNDKDLKDYVTGFHKRKKKRRQEAQRQLQEKERLKRIGQRKKRKLEKEFALYGAVSSVNTVGSGSGPNECGDEPEEDGPKETTSVSGAKMYDNGETTVTVTTMDLSRIDENVDAIDVPRLGCGSEKEHCSSEKKPLKQVAKKAKQKPVMRAKSKSFKKRKKSLPKGTGKNKGRKK
ncbi:uncharacterized protein [Aristolochia californica]|uniref:uncharacterized protein n=1 Tax=Aristolochia californica TaxID=171875 RepID=UPI0035D6130B